MQLLRHRKEQTTVTTINRTVESLGTKELEMKKALRAPPSL
jgi:hypothetical protein